MHHLDRFLGVSMSFFLVSLLVFLSLTLVFLYNSLNNEKREKNLLSASFKKGEKALLDRLKKEESQQKDLQEKVLQLSKRVKKSELKKTSEKKVLQTKKIEPIVSPLEEENSNLKRLSDHLKDQVDALIEQIKEKDTSFELIKSELKKQTQDRKADLQSKLLELKQEQGKLKERAQDQKKKNNKFLLELKLEKKNYTKKVEVEFKKIKKKLKHYQHFYAMSLSQKNMLEEKISNWEKALVILSTWILKKEKGSENMGELVASAIEQTGYGSLIEDEFNFKPLEKKNILSSQKPQVNNIVMDKNDKQQIKPS